MMAMILMMITKAAIEPTMISGNLRSVDFDCSVIGIVRSVVVMGAALVVTSLGKPILGTLSSGMSVCMSVDTTIESDVNTSSALLEGALSVVVLGGDGVIALVLLIWRTARISVIPLEMLNIKLKLVLVSKI